MPKQTFTARIIKSGRITIPSRIREFLKLEMGDFVQVTVDTVKKGSE